MHWFACFIICSSDRVEDKEILVFIMAQPRVDASVDFELWVSVVIRRRLDEGKIGSFSMKLLVISQSKVSYLKMPRAQDILSGAVLWTSSLIILQIVADLSQVTAENSQITGDFPFSDQTKFINEDWSQEDLAMLKQVMDEHVSRFRVELEEYNFSPRSRRSERGKRELS